MIAYGLVDNELYAAATTASLALVAAAWYSIERKALASTSLLLAFISGNVIVFGYTLVAYVELTTLATGTYYELTAWLTALLAWSALAGGIGAHKLMRRPRLPPATGLIYRWQSALVSGVLFAALAIALVLTGLLQGRWDDAGDEGFGLQYLAEGLGNLAYVLFLVLGTRLRGALMAPKNVAILAVVAVIATAQGLSGGREYSLVMFAFLLLGAATGGSLTRTAMISLVSFAIVFGAAFIVIVGIARDDAQFGQASVSDRIAAFGEAARHSTDVEDDPEERPLARFLGRTFEASAQVVIDQTVRTQHFAGFERFDRLRYLFVPKVVAPDKEDIDGGREILIRDFGYHLHRNTSVPITLVADAYRRGGAPWVAAVGLLAGIVLRLLAQATMVVLGSEFAALGLAMIAIICLRAYPASVPGLIFVLTYQAFKQVLLVLGFMVFVKVSILLTENARSTHSHGFR